MTQMTNQETDTALILENELTRRVREVMQGIVWEIVDAEFKKRFTESKESLMMEIAISVGNMIRLAEKEGRKPLWECNLEEFGITKENLNTHHLGEGIKNALREQTTPVQA